MIQVCSELGLLGESMDRETTVRTSRMRLQPYFPNLPLNSKLELRIVLRQQLDWAWRNAW